MSCCNGCRIDCGGDRLIDLILVMPLTVQWLQRLCAVKAITKNLFRGVFFSHPFDSFPFLLTSCLFPLYLPAFKRIMDLGSDRKRIFCVFGAKGTCPVTLVPPNAI